MNEKEQAGVSRRAAMRGAIALAAAGLAHSALAQAPQPQKKLAQKVVMYQTSPKNGQSCSKCAHFEPPASCQLVAGKISPNGWCELFAAKS